MTTTQAGSADYVQPFKTFDLDYAPTFESAFKEIYSSDTSNFVVYFNSSQASCAVNLAERSLTQWTKAHDAKHGTRWINFWVDEDQKPMLEYLAKEYDISPRLLAFLCPTSRRFNRREKTDQVTHPEDTQSQGGASSRSADTNDVEKAAAVHVSFDGAEPKPCLESMCVTDVVNDLWHFSTVDWGHRYLYIGVNVLSLVSDLPQSASYDKPAGQRLWTSLLLCDDGTIISTCERPISYASEKLRAASLKSARRHVCNIFRHLSRASQGDVSKASDLMNVKIRPDSVSPKSRNTREQNIMENSSLLFYYLFDDWMTTYALIARIEHPYRKMLEQVRQEMTNSPNVALLEKLHSLGRQLTVLKLVYESYAQVTSRLLGRHQSTPSMASPESNAKSPRSPSFLHQGACCGNQYPSRGSNPWSRRSMQNNFEACPLSTPSSTIQLSLLSIVRFERLLDRIHLYALNEIQQCLDEKESLVFMTFNLLTLSESRSIEKLTRMTIILAKATIFFLPVSLLTAYFSIQVGHIDEMYSLRTYWMSFAVVSILSIIFLLFFSVKTGQIPGQSFYKDMHSFLLENTRHAIFDRKRKKP